MEAELEIARVNARHDVEAAQAARQQAEELLLALRVKYGDLQHQVTTATEDLAEAKAENEILDAERERLVQQVEALEASQRGPVSPSVPPLVEKPVEVFELEISDEDDAEEIMLLEEEATDPGKKDPRKP